MSVQADKCVVCGDDFIHPELIWKVNGESCCSPDCALTLSKPQESPPNGRPLVESFPDGICATAQGIFNSKR
jgi:hypothetical protein